MLERVTLFPPYFINWQFYQVARYWLSDLCFKAIIEDLKGFFLWKQRWRHRRSQKWGELPSFPSSGPPDCLCRRRRGYRSSLAADCLCLSFCPNSPSFMTQPLDTHRYMTLLSRVKLSGMLLVPDGRCQPISLFLISRRWAALISLPVRFALFSKLPNRTGYGE